MAVTSFYTKLSQKSEKLLNGGSLGGRISRTELEYENRLSQRDEELSSAYLSAIARKKVTGFCRKCRTNEVPQKFRPHPNCDPFEPMLQLSVF